MKPTGAQLKILNNLYPLASQALDQLPYTAEFERMHAAYSACRVSRVLTLREFWKLLLSARKAGKLVTKGKGNGR